MKRLFPSLLVLTVFLPFAVSEAGSTCTYNQWTNSTTCTGDNGWNATGTYNQWTNSTTWSGSNGNGSSWNTTCSYNQWTGSTTCN